MGKHLQELFRAFSHCLNTGRCPETTAVWPILQRWHHTSGIWIWGIAEMCGCSQRESAVLSHCCHNL